MKKKATTKRPPLPSLYQIEVVLEFLPTLGKASSRHCKWRDIKGEMPSCALSKQGDLFHRALYHEGFVMMDFEWPSWQKEGRRYMNDPGLLTSADMRILCQLFTMHVRKDRFCEGLFGSLLVSGHIGSMLRRLSAIRNELIASGAKSVAPPTRKRRNPE